MFLDAVGGIDDVFFCFFVRGTDGTLLVLWFYSGFGLLRT